ncbi:hypothetical protein [Thermogemmatispora tikiterensis]|uniref:DUF4386 domain-containing protein n=1 Tax=Thermogemmatispora tikiterensis TaxID=1825093 RepID=A0A328VKY1_9CHLR|nr:hypothetical protein [Thermogemmatispora tikiterensis]RAQ96842.1 hypothetical protein A4R35_14990 [Thermogemmatispora tikiterensis]
MRRTFLTRLRINGSYYVLGGLLLLLGAPLYQWLWLLPHGYGEALAAANRGQLAVYVLWLHLHVWSFAFYRLLQMVAFALTLSLPFTLFRIIVAQEVLGRDEGEGAEAAAAAGETSPSADDQQRETAASDKLLPQTAEELLAIPWRGKGFAVIAAWSGMLGILLLVLGNLASTVYQIGVARTFTAEAALTPTFALVVEICTLVSNTAGGLLVALATLLFGVIIVRSGLQLWPPLWVALGYVAILLALFLIGSAVQVALAPASGQAFLTTPAFLLFALWTLWLGLILVRLRPAPAS